jgi:uroporphyrinogen-III decarboxylase
VESTTVLANPTETLWQLFNFVIKVYVSIITLLSGQDAQNFISYKPTITAGADAIAFYDTLVTPSSHGVDVNMQYFSYPTCGNHMFIAIVHFRPPKELLK